MSKRVNYAITDNNITVNYDGQTHIVARTDALAEKLLAALREKRNDDIPKLVSAAKRIEHYGKGDFKVDGGIVFVNGQPVHEVLSRKILRFQADGLPHTPLVKFAANLQKNPSYRAVNELFLFLEKNDHPITEEGNFIAYKRVRSTFKDIHSNTMDNSPGTFVSIPRNQVDEDCTRTCSHGLHVANWSYAHSSGFASHDPASDIMLEVEVNPSDVVAIPVDYDNAKMRVCAYQVLGVVDSAHSDDVQLRRVNQTQLDEEEIMDECDSCGDEVPLGELLCDFCADDEEHENFEDEDEDEDEYPYRDELDYLNK